MGIFIIYSKHNNESWKPEGWAIFEEEAIRKSNHIAEYHRLRWETSYPPNRLDNESYSYQIRKINVQKP